MNEVMDNVLVDDHVEEKRRFVGRMGVCILLDDGCLIEGT